MKAEELAVIKERADKATSGPWETDVWSNAITNEGGSIDIIASVDGQLSVFDADADFIANAREDVPKLVAEVERLQRKLAYMCSKDVPYMIRNFGEESYYAWSDNIAREALK